MTQILRAALLALALSSPVQTAPALDTQSALPPNSTYVSDGTPPVRYQGNVAEVVIFTDRRGIDSICGVAPRGLIILACTVRQNDVPITVMPNPCLSEATDAYAHLMCHEMGHANGWPPTHGD